MAAELLQKWLGLPAGAAWPPDDRTLLGLPPGPADPFAVEKRAMELMDRLRPYQLAHPDLVTDGMNRLAQAMVALSSSLPTVPPPAPTRKIAKPPAAKPAPKPPPAPEPAPPPTLPAFEAVDFALPDAPAEPAVVEARIVEAEIVEAEIVEPAVSGGRLAPRVGPGTRGASAPPEKPRPAVDEPAPIDFAPPAPDGFVVPTAGRREAYRDLARLRRLRKAWRRLRASVADPAEPLPGPAEVCGFLEAVHEVRAALAVPGTGDDVFGPAGANVRAVVRHPMPLAVFRSLVPAQRQALARDWAVGLAATETRYGAVRGFLLKDAFGRRTARRRAQTVRRHFARNPEWVMAGMTLVVLGMAAVRAVR